MYLLSYFPVRPSYLIVSQYYDIIVIRIAVSCLLRIYLHCNTIVEWKCQTVFTKLFLDWHTRSKVFLLYKSLIEPNNTYIQCYIRHMSMGSPLLLCVWFIGESKILALASYARAKKGNPETKLTDYPFDTILFISSTVSQASFCHWYSQALTATVHNLTLFCLPSPFYG